jgi:hypothetical protein
MRRILYSGVPVFTRQLTGADGRAPQAARCARPDRDPAGPSRPVTIHFCKLRGTPGEAAVTVCDLQYLEQAGDTVKLDADDHSVTRIE